MRMEDIQFSCGTITEVGNTGLNTDLCEIQQNCSGQPAGKFADAACGVLARTQAGQTPPVGNGAHSVPSEASSSLNARLSLLEVSRSMPRAGKLQQCL